MTKAFKGKKIILSITTEVDLYKCIIENLEHLGFEVILICNEGKFKYKSIFDKITNRFRKVFFKDKSYKQKLKNDFYKNSQLNKLSLLKDIDYSLSIRPDLFDLEVIQKIVSISRKNYAYQWDGLNRFPEVCKLIPLFDKFYVFDKNDLKSEFKTYPTTNFYFDYMMPKTADRAIDFDLFYIGSYDNRIKTIVPLCEIFYKKGLKLNIVLKCSPKTYLKKYPYISFTKKPLTYSKNLEIVSKSKLILDIQHKNLHTGLSFRPFDALGLNKKLVTTNHIIKDYDFYNPNNIFLIDDNLNLDSFDTFLNSDYEDTAPQIKQKYSFTNWIKYILEEDGASFISIP